MKSRCKRVDLDDLKYVKLLGFASGVDDFPKKSNSAFVSLLRNTEPTNPTKEWSVCETSTMSYPDCYQKVLGLESRTIKVRSIIGGTPTGWKTIQPT